MFQLTRKGIIQWKIEVFLEIWVTMFLSDILFEVKFKSKATWWQVFLCIILYVCMFHLKLMGVGGGSVVYSWMTSCVHASSSFPLTRYVLPKLSSTNKTKITRENTTVSGIFQYRLYSLRYIYLCLQTQLSINFWWFWWLLWPLVEIGSLESVVVLKELRTDNIFS